jgi:hypothetical protein
MEHPDAISFLRISGVGLFQQPRLFSSTMGELEISWKEEQLMDTA